MSEIGGPFVIKQCKQSAWMHIVWYWNWNWAGLTQSWVTAMRISLVANQNTDGRCIYGKSLPYT